MAAETRSSCVDIIDMYKTFDGGQIVACNDVNIRISDDELLVLLGPSGSGKTTALRCIAGLERPNSGSIVIDGVDVTSEPPKDRDVAFVFQDTTLFPHMTVRENMRFGLDLKTDLDADQKRRRIEETARTLGIGNLLDRDPGTLSGGQQQRVGLGRAMVMEPDVFLLDEPFSALDANLRDQMQTEIQQLQNELETSMIFVTHDQQEAMTIGDRIVIMNDGSVQQIGTPHEIYNDPANRFVAEFIGSPSTNIMACSYTIEKGRVRIQNDCFTVSVAMERPGDIRSHEGNTIGVGIRPEKLQLGTSSGRFTATVDIVEPLGDSDIVHLNADGLRVSAKSESGSYAEHDEVSVDFGDEDVWLFGDDGIRIPTRPEKRVPQ